MKDERKTKKQLINELVELRQRTAVLEKAEVLTKKVHRPAGSDGITTAVPDKPVFLTNKVHRPVGSDGGSADETLIKVS